MSEDIIITVYKRFCDLDMNNPKWTDLDECLHLLDWLSDKEIVTEATIKTDNLNKGQPRCFENHSMDECFVPTIIQAVEKILHDYDTTKSLYEGRRFILSYYLALSQKGYIIC